MKFDVLVSCPVVCHPASQSPQRGSLPRCVAFGLLKGGRRKATSFKGCSFLNLNEGTAFPPPFQGAALTPSFDRTSIPSKGIALKSGVGFFFSMLWSIETGCPCAVDEGHPVSIDHNKMMTMGEEGFEPPTPWFVATCSSPLSYTPMSLYR